MQDPFETIRELREENSSLKQKIRALEQSKTVYEQVDEMLPNRQKKGRTLPNNEYKRAEKERRATEEKYREILENAIEGIFQW